MTSRERRSDKGEAKMRFIFLGCFFVLVGCTSTVNISDVQIKKRDALTETSATEQLTNFLHYGICRHVDPVTFGSDAQAEISKGILLFTAKKKVSTGGSVSGSGGTLYMSSTYKLVPTRYSADLKNLKDVQIVDSPGTSGCTTAGLSWVIVHPQDGLFFIIKVRPTEVDDLVADLAYFTPNITIKSGAGF
jgi:hypothetical protein